MVKTKRPNKEEHEMVLLRLIKNFTSEFCFVIDLKHKQIQLVFFI